MLQARAATAEFERLRDGELRDFRVGADARADAAGRKAGGDGRSSRRRGADVLVATSVIEVGIDVPNATVMLVEDAERYGISQLHQLRGRIGRGEHPSVCILFGAKDSPRLRALAESGDGFELAEIDLELRGEGELVGTRQHGLAQFRVAELPRGRGAARARARSARGRSLDDDRDLSLRRARAAGRRAGAGLRHRGRGADPGVSRGRSECG